MRIAYLQPVSGIAGNMLIGACLDAGVAWEDLAKVLEPLGIGEWSPIQERATRGGIVGTYFNVEVDDPAYRPGDHVHECDVLSHRHQAAADPVNHAPHRHYPDVVAIIEQALHLPEDLGRRALEILRRIGEAESQLHGIPLTELHLHEIGAMDTIIDVVGGLAALNLLGVERVYADPVHVGTGYRETAHGIVPIPTPATMAILGEHPVVMDRPGFELTTPTGAALLMTLLAQSDTVGRTPPPGKVIATGWGAGSADLPDRPNLLRLLIMETADAPVDPCDDPRWNRDQVVTLRTNIDDLSPERYPPLTAQLLALGALDVTTTATIMKGGRPGVILEVLCRESEAQACIALLFAEGVTLGMRVATEDRVHLRREASPVILRDGTPVVGKTGFLGESPVRTKPEMRDVVAHAQATGQPVGALHPDAGNDVVPEANEYGEFDNVEFILSLLNAPPP